MNNNDPGASQRRSITGHDDPGHLLSKADVARITGTSERFVQRLIQERRLPTVKVGRYVRVWPADLEAYLSRQTRPASPAHAGEEARTLLNAGYSHARRTGNTERGTR